MKFVRIREIQPLRWFVTTVLITVSIAAISAGCRQPPDAAPVPKVERVQFGSKTPVIIYLIDTLRADKVGAYGNSRSLTPAMDALARESVLYEQAYAAAPWTLPSVASLFSSSFVTEHGITKLKYPIPAEMHTFAQVLANAGYECGAFVSNANTVPVRAEGRGYRASALRDKHFDREEIATWFKLVGSKPYHLYLHTTEPHNPFAAPLDFINAQGHSLTADDVKRANDAMQRFRDMTMLDKTAGRPLGSTDTSADLLRLGNDLNQMRPLLDVLYDTHIQWADGHLGAFIERLKVEGRWDECIFVLLSDHGEEWGEHGGWQHDQSVYDELVRVPLMIKYPRGHHAGRRIERPVTLIDVVPTLLDALSLKDSGGRMRGRSLLDWKPDTAGSDTEQPVVVSVRVNDSKYYKDVKTQRGDINVAMRLGKWKAIYNVEPDRLELYDLSNDAAERFDQSSAQPEIAEQLRRYAMEWFATQVPPDRMRTSAPLDRGALENLRKLGYLLTAEDEDDDAKIEE